RSVALGMNASVNSIAGAVVQVLIFAILGSSVAAVVAGSPVYTPDAFQAAYLTAAAVGALGLIVSLLIPHGRRQPRSEPPTSDPQSDSPLRTAPTPKIADKDMSHLI
ncbi:hypothetical protein ACFTZB_40705, partial [Rhodococcus sp. NPDC057014]